MNKSIKLFAASALAISALGLSAVSTSLTAEAATVTQISGDEKIGEIELVTNTFPTYETARDFVNGKAAQILYGESYQGETTPVLPGSGYVVSIRIQYDALTSKEQAIALANQVVAAADTAIGGSNSQPTPQPTPIPPQDKTSQLKVYRLYHAGLQVHLYTTDTNEATVLQSRGWKYEGISWNSERQQGESVYRLYHPALKVHLYTKDTNEYRVLAGRGWKQEGVAYRSYGTVPVYRMYHTGLKKHLYTKDRNEYSVLAGRGWKQEGIAWYSQP